VTVELDTVRKYRQQIQKGLLTRDLQVTVYRRGQRDKVVTAGTVPELGPIFDEVLGALSPLQLVDADLIEPVDTSTSDNSGASADPAEPEGTKPETAEPLVLRTEHETAPSPEALKSEVADPVDVTSSPESLIVEPKVEGESDATVDKAVDQITTPVSPPGKVSRGKGFSRFLLGGIALAAVLALSQVLKPGRAVTETDYVSRTTKVRREPAATGAEVGEVSRGDQLVGRIVKGVGGSSRWLQLTEGAWKEDYVWAENLSHDPRPALASTEHKIRKVKSTSMMWTQPNAGSQTVRSVEVGDRVVVLGKTADGWREIELDGGGIAYLPPAAFGEGGSPSKTQTALGPTASSPPTVPVAQALSPPPPPPPPVATLPQAPARPAYINAPPWLRRPTAADQARLAPSRAVDQNQNGRATLDCVINNSGLLTDCSVVEDPIGWGFGQAALDLARLYQSASTTSDGQSTAGSRVKIRFRFDFAQ
jgi:TonB family protein